MNPNNPNDRTQFAFLDDDKLDAFKHYEVDLEDALKNILDCDGDDFDFSDASSIDFDGTYPPCMLAMKVEGMPKGEQDLEVGTQSCTAKDRGMYATWSVEISADYSGDACNAVYDAIKDRGTGMAPTNWQCVEQGGQFQLWFDYAKHKDGSGDILNSAFEEVFPSEGGEYGNVDGFNCPDS